MVETSSQLIWVHLIKDPGGSSRENRGKAKLKELQIFSKLMKNVKSTDSRSITYPKGDKTNKCMLDTSWWNCKHQRQIVKAAREKVHITYKGMSALMSRLSNSSDGRHTALKCNLDSFGGKAFTPLKDPWQLGCHESWEGHQQGSQGPGVQKNSTRGKR